MGREPLICRLADLEYLDPDHPTLTVEIKHGTRRNLFGADGFDTFWPNLTNIASASGSYDVLIIAGLCDRNAPC